MNHQQPQPHPLYQKSHHSSTLRSYASTLSASGRLYHHHNHHHHRGSRGAISCGSRNARGAERKTWIRFLTVCGYVFCVSAPAVFLSYYYMRVWDIKYVNKHVHYPPSRHGHDANNNHTAAARSKSPPLSSLASVTTPQRRPPAPASSFSSSQPLRRASALSAAAAATSSATKSSASPSQAPLASPPPPSLLKRPRRADGEASAPLSAPIVLPRDDDGPSSAPSHSTNAGRDNETLPLHHPADEAAEKAQRIGAGEEADAIEATTEVDEEEPLPFLEAASATTASNADGGGATIALEELIATKSTSPSTTHSTSDNTSIT